jgi:hypothetical protein
MRHLFLAFLIALLPLRGWVGDVMAAQMSSAALAQTAAVHPHPTQHPSPHGTAAEPAMALHADPHADCPGHAAMLADAAASHDTADNSEDPCNSCTVCQLCHTPALTVEIVKRPLMAAAVPPQATPHVYTDALRVPGFKPPIA